MKGIRGQRSEVGKGGGKKWPVVSSAFSIQHLPVIIPSPLSPLPSPLSPALCPLPPAPSRTGISLLEVLISIFILSIGLLGVAALIPIGKLALIETNKSDRTGACGRAALHDLKVRRLLDYVTPWQPNCTYPLGAIVRPLAMANGRFYLCTTAGTSHSTTEPTWPNAVGSTVNDNGIIWRDIGMTLPSLFAIDPLWFSASPSFPYAIGNIARINVLTAPSVFQWHDELTFDVPKEATARPRAIVQDNVGIVGPYPDATMTPPVHQLDDGNFSWFVTASQDPLQATLFNISAVVCYKRVLAPEQTCTANDAAIPANPPAIVNGGGAVLLTPATNGTTVNVKADEWILLCNATGTRAGWYRIVNAGPGGATQTVSVVGPDWDATMPATAVIIPGVTGVYTSTVQLN